MKARRLLLAAGLAAVTTLVMATTAFAGSHNRVDCGGGKLVVNVTFQVYNDYDSGVTGNSWANDTLTRHVQVFDLGGGTYCAVDNDHGSFVTFAGASPNGSGTVSAGIKGVIDGGYTTTVFTGTLNPNAAYATKGNLGSFDLQCVTYNDCPGAHPSFLSYFSGSPSWGYASWGWTYHTARNGNWMNTSSVNSGDIIG